MEPTSASLLNVMTGHGNTTTKPHNSKFCPSPTNLPTSSVPLIVNVAINVPPAIVTTFANLFVLLAMRHVTSIRLPSKLLLCSLVLTDLGAGLVAHPQFAVLLFMRTINQYRRVQCFLEMSFGFTAALFACASLFIMVAISLDRYTALFFHFRYKQIVTTRRVCAVLTFIWLLSLFLASTRLWNRRRFIVLLLAGFVICFLVISVAYIKIYRRLRSQHGHHVQPQVHDQAQQQAANTLNMAKYKRTASAMIWLYVLFVVCYLPYLCALSIVAAFGHMPALTQCIRAFSQTLMLLNSCLNPFVYCLRLPEIRTEVIKQLRRFCCRSPQQ